MPNHDPFRRLAGSHSFDGRAALLTLALFGVVLAAGGSSGAIDTARPAIGPGGSVVRASVGAEIAGLRGARSRTFSSARGTRTVRLFAAPVNVREGAAWRVADETLVERGESYESRSSPFEVELPKHLTEAVKVGEHGEDVAMTLEGARGAPRMTLSPATPKPCRGWTSAMPSPAISSRRS